MLFRRISLFLEIVLCFYALFVILLKIYYLLSNKLFINVPSLSDLMPAFAVSFRALFRYRDNRTD